MTFKKQANKFESEVNVALRQAKEDYDIGFSINVDVDDWDILEEKGFDNDFLNDQIVKVERNLMNALKKSKFVTWIRDEGHSGEELIGSAGIGEETLRNIFGGWEFIDEGKYLVNTSSGTLWDTVKDREVFKDIDKNITPELNIDLEFFDLPPE